MSSGEIRLPAGRMMSDSFEPQGGLEVGDEGYLIWVTDISPNARRAGTDEPRWGLYGYPGRKNLSREIVLNGWLGTTHDISERAEGYVRITRATARGYYVTQVAPPSEEDTKGGMDDAWHVDTASGYRRVGHRDGKHYVFQFDDNCWTPISAEQFNLIIREAQEWASKQES